MKRFAAAVLSMVLCLGTMAVPMGASAYDKCDVNRDGKVDITDTIYINRYLMGAHYVMDYNRLDVDNTRTIDANDANYVLAKVTQSSYSVSYYSKKNGTFPSVPSTVSTAGVYPVTGSRSYARYSYKTGKRLSNYTLTLTTKQDNANAQEPMPYTIFGSTDSRKNMPGDENKGIVRVGGGTGFIVGDHQIATAAHCVSSQSGGTFYAKPEIQLYDKSGKLTGEKLTAIEAHVPTLYFVEGNHPDYDYALITVAEDLSSYPHFEIAETYNLSEAGFANVPINITGCPGAVNGPNTEHLLYTAEGRVVSTVEGCRYSLRTNVDMSGGDSGAPVYTIIAAAQGTKINYSFVVLGVNAYEGVDYNFGSRFDRFHKQFYLNNPNTSTS